MIDRFGKPVLVGWATHELLWVEAALTLRASERRAALKDISDMTGRSFLAVQAKAEQIASEARLEAAERAMIAQRPLVPAAIPVRPNNGPRRFLGSKAA